MIRRTFLIALGAVLLAIIAAPAAFACACCADTAWRYVELEKLRPKRLSEIERIRFAKSAKLMGWRADQDMIRGVQNPSENYQLTVSRDNDMMIFNFLDERGRSGTLKLAMPKTISIFEVDPRGSEKDTGLGPSLYKEWKLTMPAKGEGLFRDVTGPGQKLTLVLHGRGNMCTSAGDFSDWTLLIYGASGNITLYGALDLPAR